MKEEERKRGQVSIRLKKTESVAEATNSELYAVIETVR